MLGRFTLVLDSFCELADQIRPWADHEYWDFASHTPVANSVTIVSRQTLNAHSDRIKTLAQEGHFVPVLVNPTEGSETMRNQCAMLGLLDLNSKGKFLTVGCGDMEKGLANLWYDSYVHKPYDYKENLEECERAQQIYSRLQKPYQYLFLNGRTRAHRKYLIESLRDRGLLDCALWTNLDQSPVPGHTNFYGKLCERQSDIRLLPSHYELPFCKQANKKQFENSFVKNELFDGIWGEIYLKAEPYIDTYFSLVSETVFDYPYTLRSEKIYKPIAIGHPFVVAANCGFYRDLHRAGFKTFGHLIDESFDKIENGLDRLNRIVDVVQHLCAQDLDEFVVAAREVCVYNQQHMKMLGSTIKSQFILEFYNFLNKWIPND